MNVRKLSDFGEFSLEALEGNNIDEVKLNSMTRREILDMVLTWHGIGWFTGSIIGVFDDLCILAEDI